MLRTISLPNCSLNPWYWCNVRRIIIIKMNFVEVYTAFPEILFRNKWISSFKMSMPFETEAIRKKKYQWMNETSWYRKRFNLYSVSRHFTIFNIICCKNIFLFPFIFLLNWLIYTIFSSCSIYFQVYLKRFEVIASFHTRDSTLSTDDCSEQQWINKSCKPFRNQKWTT